MFRTLFDLLRLPTRPRRTRSHSCQVLESRTLLASLVSATKLTYQDRDGDDVTVTFSKSILTAANVNIVFAFDLGNVNGSNTTKQQLRSINLTGIAGAAGTTITTVAKRNTTNGGDGYAALGQIDATGFDLGAVTVDGDLGRILAGDSNTVTGVVSLKVHSIGRFGISTGAVNLATEIRGKLGSLTTRSDIKDAFFWVIGDVDLIAVGGSLIGGTAADTGDLLVDGKLGSLKIAGDIVGGSGSSSGAIFTSKLISASISGSVIGGNGIRSGYIRGTVELGVITIAGSLLGSIGFYSGSLFSQGNIASVTIGGSVVGGNGDSSARVESQVSLGAVKVTGDVSGGAGIGSGAVYSALNLTSVTIGGSLRGGAGQQGGSIIGGSFLGGQSPTSITLGGSVIGGTAPGGLTGTVNVFKLGSLSVHRSLVGGSGATTNGAILASTGIGTITIDGNIVGSSTQPALIQAFGQINPSATTDLALGSLTVKGRVENALIRVGYDGFGQAQNADAQIGAVNVTGDWISSSLVAGATAGLDHKFGNGDDTKISGPGVKDVAGVVSSIKSVTIGGQAFGTPGSGDGFGIVAEVVGSFKVGDTIFPTITGKSNDSFFVGLFSDFAVNEI